MTRVSKSLGSDSSGFEAIGHRFDSCPGVPCGVSLVPRISMLLLRTISLLIRAWGEPYGVNRPGDEQQEWRSESNRDPCDAEHLGRSQPWRTRGPLESHRFLHSLMDRVVQRYGAPTAITNPPSCMAGLLVTKSTIPPWEDVRAARGSPMRSRI
jgi:hypothetical protein